MTALETIDKIIEFTGNEYESETRQSKYGNARTLINFLGSLVEIRSNLTRTTPIELFRKAKDL